MAATRTRARSAASSAGASPEAQLRGFLARYPRKDAALARALRRRLRALIPGGHEFIYDNYQGLVIGFGTTDRPSEAIFSIVMYFRRVSICFLHGARLKDPKRILRGSGNQVRNIRVDDPALLDQRDVRELLAQAISRAIIPPNQRQRRIVEVRAIHPRPLPRRGDDE